MPAPAPPIRKPNLSAQDRAWEIYGGGALSIREVAEAMNEPISTVRDWLQQYKKRHGIKPEPRFTGRIQHLGNRAA